MQMPFLCIIPWNYEWNYAFMYWNYALCIIPKKCIKACIIEWLTKTHIMDFLSQIMDRVCEKTQKIIPVTNMELCAPNRYKCAYKLCVFSLRIQKTHNFKREKIWILSPSILVIFKKRTTATLMAPIFSIAILANHTSVCFDRTLKRHLFFMRIKNLTANEKKLKV